MHSRDGDDVGNARDGKLVAHRIAQTAAVSGQKGLGKARHVFGKDLPDLLPGQDGKSCRKQRIRQLLCLGNFHFAPLKAQQRNVLRLVIEVILVAAAPGNIHDLCRNADRVPQGKLPGFAVQIEHHPAPSHADGHTAAVIGVHGTVADLGRHSPVLAAKLPQRSDLQPFIAPAPQQAKGSTQGGNANPVKGVGGKTKADKKAYDTHCGQRQTDRRRKQPDIACRRCREGKRENRQSAHLPCLLSRKKGRAQYPSPKNQLKLPSCLPPSTWKCRCLTVCPASSPQLVTTR